MKKLIVLCLCLSACAPKPGVMTPEQTTKAIIQISNAHNSLVKAHNDLDTRVAKLEPVAPTKK